MSIIELRNAKLDKIASLFLKYKEPLVDYCVKKTHGNESEAVDLVQDIMLQACVQRDELDIDDSEQTQRQWLFSIARQVLFKYHQRKLHRVKIVTMRDIEAPTTPDDSSMLTDLADEVLDPSDADILKMRLDGFSYKEIALAHHSNDSAMRQRLHRSIKKLIQYHQHNKNTF